MTIVNGRFEWDSVKDEINKKKHGFSFEEILEVFDDPFLLCGRDNAHSDSEEREFCIGCLNGTVVILVIYTERERTHIISARKADKKWRRFYDDFIKKTFG